ncbi:hypothetical protein KW800_00160 [Candidatus Parcubacteria bacterium]|nr:hypothetical protein [Candidatus Parcubacteria bacterium]
MTLQIIFAASGVGIAAIIWAKVLEDKHKRKPALLRLISLGDAHARTLSHELSRRYFEWKEEADFFLNKELPFRTRTFINKTNVTVKERFDKHVGDIRGSKFLKKNDGLNEFFKNLSEKENGRIDDELSQDSSEIEPRS